jgi:hypothetical protein
LKDLITGEDQLTNERHEVVELADP